VKGSSRDFYGWVGGSCAQPTVIREALKALQDGHARLLRISPTPQAGAEPQEGVYDFVMTCASQGALEIYVEPFLPRPTLQVIGETPVAPALARFGAQLDFTVWVSDPDVTRERSEVDARHTRLEDACAQVQTHTYVVVATQGRMTKRRLAVLNTAAGYIGLVASSRRAAAICQTLPDQGVPRASATHHLPCLSACCNSGDTAAWKILDAHPERCAMLSWIVLSLRMWTPYKTMKPCSARLRHRVPSAAMANEVVCILWLIFQRLDRLRGVKTRCPGDTGTLRGPLQEGRRCGWVRGQMLGLGQLAAVWITGHRAHRPSWCTRLPFQALLGDRGGKLASPVPGSRVFIEPLDTEHLQPYSLYATLKSHVDQGGAGALLTCLDGATTGAKLLLLDNGTRLGTLGSLGPDQAAIDMAHAQITQGTSRTVRFPLPQASVRVFVEVHSPPGRKAVARDLAGRAQNDAPPASGQVCPPASPGCPGGNRRLSHPGQDDCLLTSFALWATLYRGRTPRPGCYRQMYLNHVLSHHTNIRLTGGAALLLRSLTGIIWRNCFHGNTNAFMLHG
jgi:xanthine/CO dehydrogenase XdhC/CoxF family maturation factor